MNYKRCRYGKLKDSCGGVPIVINDTLVVSVSLPAPRNGGNRGLSAE